MSRSGSVAFLALAAAVALAACSILDPEDSPRERLGTARDRWESRDITDYQYRFRHSCGECLPAFARTYFIRVENGSVVEVVDAETGEPAPAGYEAHTVPELFDIVLDAIDQSAVVLEVEYDPQLGYPRLISVDYSRDIADDEFAMTVAEFESLPD